MRKNDFTNQPDLKDDDFKQAIVTTAVTLGRDGFISLPFATNDLAGRTIHQITDLASEIVLRKAGQNIRKITGAKQSNRMEIIRRLRLFCEEGMSFTIAKMDIEKFYPSIAQKQLSQQIERRLVTAPSTRRVIGSLIAQFEQNSISGLPPGLAISSELSEFYMQDFDASMRGEMGAHFYARYVDDIILILPEIRNIKFLRKRVEQYLPIGLRLNSSKSKVLKFGAGRNRSQPLEHLFDYLGYEFQVSESGKDKPYSRKVKLDIAKSKVKKNKTRICKSLLQYLADGKFDDLRDRVKLLTCGYQFIDQRKSVKRNAGIQHTYSLIDTDSIALRELDQFLTSIVLCKSGKIGFWLNQCLTNRERKELLSHSFLAGFANKTHFHFGASRLAYLIGCWKYV